MNRKRLVPITAGVLAALGLGVTLWGLGRTRGLQASGTIEARNIRVGSKIGGRIAGVHVREGDRVEPGQLIVSFEDHELAAELEQARGRVARARAQLEKMQRGYTREEVEEARAAEASARAQLDEMSSGYRREQVEQSRAALERARAEAENAERIYQRAARLAQDGVYSAQQRDDAETAWRAARARLEEAQQRLNELERGYRVEEVAAAEARYRQAKAVRQRIERGFRQEDVAAARAELIAAEGQLREAEARYRERQVLAPAAAVVEVLDVRPGDLVPPNTPIATLLERDQLYIRIYIPETRLAQVRVGQPAEVRVDSLARQVFRAEVEQINQKAEFLPRNVQTREEREHQLFGVKLRIRDPEGRLRVGIAADVRLLEK